MTTFIEIVYLFHKKTQDIIAWKSGRQDVIAMAD
jgi:hypothetical protein